MLLKSLKEGSPSVRYFAATGLGNLKNGDETIVQTLRRSLTDSIATVRLASAIALSKLDQDEKVPKTLVSELHNQNLLVRLYAILGLEEIGKKALSVRQEIENMTEGEYEYVRRVARRLEKRFANWTKS